MTTYFNTTLIFLLYKQKWAKGMYAYFVMGSEAELLRCLASDLPSVTDYMDYIDFTDMIHVKGISAQTLILIVYLSMHCKLASCFLFNFWQGKSTEQCLKPWSTLSSLSIILSFPCWIQCYMMFMMQIIKTVVFGMLL